MILNQILFQYFYSAGEKTANPFPGWENQNWACLFASKVKNKDSWLGKRISDTIPGWEEHFLTFVWLALRSGYYFPTKVNYQPNSTQWLLKDRFGRKRSNFGNFLVESSCTRLIHCTTRNAFHNRDPLVHHVYYHEMSQQQ